MTTILKLYKRDCNNISTRTGYSTSDEMGDLLKFIEKAGPTTGSATSLALDRVKA